MLRHRVVFLCTYDTGMYVSGLSPLCLSDFWSTVSAQLRSPHRMAVFVIKHYSTCSATLAPHRVSFSCFCILSLVNTIFLVLFHCINRV